MCAVRKIVIYCDCTSSSAGVRAGRRDPRPRVTADVTCTVQFSPVPPRRSGRLAVQAENAATNAANNAEQLPTRPAAPDIEVFPTRTMDGTDLLVRIRAADRDKLQDVEDILLHILFKQ